MNRSGITFFLSLALLISCQKDEQHHDKHDTVEQSCLSLSPPLLSSNSPVNLGDVLLLNASSAEPDVTYEWKGPEEFNSADQHVELNPALYSHNGQYFCRIKQAGCTSPYSVIVIQVNDSCEMFAFNTAIVDGISWNFYSGITCGPSGSSGFFGITAANNSGSIEIIFGNRYKKPAGYHRFPVSVFSVADSSTVQIRFIENGTEFQASSGEVYSAIEGRKSILTFCGITFTSQLSTQHLIDARLGCE